MVTCTLGPRLMDYPHLRRVNASGRQLSGVGRSHSHLSFGQESLCVGERGLSFSHMPLFVFGTRGV